MFRRSLAIAAAIISLTACGGSSDSKDTGSVASEAAVETTAAASAETTAAAAVETTAAASADTTAAAAAPAADSTSDLLVSEAEWADVKPRLEAGGVTRPTYEMVVGAVDFTCADVQTTTAPDTAQFVAAEADKVTALAPDAGLDSKDVGAIIGVVASYACADAFTKITAAS